MRSISQNILALCLGFFLLLPAALSAQNAPGWDNFNFVARGESLDFTLQRLVQKTNIDLIYDPQLMSGESVFVRANDKDPEEILRLILSETNLDFIQLSSGTYVLVKDNRQETLLGSMTGKVVDKTTGQPLRGAHVMLADASGGTSTNSAGRFNIPKLEPGHYEVTVSYVGYRPVKDTVWVPANNSIQHHISLETKPVWVEPIIVSETQKLLPAADSFTGKVENPRETSLGTIDAVKSMNTVMGINFNLALADYHIQGGNTGQHQLRLDGVPVYNPVSMGRLIGAFSPYALGTIGIHKAGYGTPAGSQLSGVVDLNHDLGNQQDQSFLMQADPLSVNGRFDYNINNEDGPDIDLMLAGRANIWRWYEKPGLAETFREWDQVDPLLTNSLLDISSTDMNYLQENHSSDIRYSDLHLAASVEHNDFQTTRISAYRGKNFLQTDLFSQNVELASDAPNHMSTIDRYNWTNWMSKVEHEWLISPRLDANISAYMTRHTLRHQYAMGNNLNTTLDFAGAPIAEQLRVGAVQNMSTGNQNGITESGVETNISYSVSKNYQIESGLKLTHLNYRFHLSDLYVNTAHSESTSFLLSNFVQNNIFLSNQTSLSVGSRFTFIPSRDLVFAEPRLSIQHDEPETVIGYLSAKLSGGIYRQFINQFDVSNIAPSALVPSMRFWVPADFSTDVPKAYHLSGNFLWEPNNHWTVEVESYYKWMPTTLSLDYRDLFDYSTIGTRSLSQQAQFITDSQQYAYGGGLSIQRVLPALQMQLTGKYQFSQVQRQIGYRFNSEYESVPWNHPHQLNFSGEWQALSDVMVLLQWKSIWGRSWGFRKAYYDYLAIADAPILQDHDFENPSGDQLPAYHQLNAGVSYNLKLKKGTLQMRMDVFNLLDHSNVMNWWLYPSAANSDEEISYETRERLMPGFSPSVSVKFSF